MIKQTLSNSNFSKRKFRFLSLFGLIFGGFNHLHLEKACLIRKLALEIIIIDKRNLLHCAKLIIGNTLKRRMLRKKDFNTQS